MNFELFNNKTILIAEDDANSRILLQEYLAGTQSELIFAKNGLEVIELAKNNDVDLILMDYKLPELDGYKASQKIKEISSVPIIAQTASILNQDIKSKLKDCFDAYILKPFSQQDLLDLIYKQFNKEKH